MIRLGETRTELGVVADQIGGPTYAGDLAGAIITIIKKKADGKAVDSGIYHYCGVPMTSWAGFAKEIFRQAEKQELLPHPVKVNDIITAEYPTPAARPAYSMMSCCRVYETYAIKPSEWHKAVYSIIKTLGV